MSRASQDGGARMLVLDGSGPGVRASLPGLGMREARRAGELAAAAALLLAEHRLRPAELAAIVGIIGPGSFTGLRAALALGLGLAAASGRPLVAVASAEAIAASAPGLALLAGFSSGRRGRFVIQPIGADGGTGLPMALDADSAAAFAVPPAAALAGPAGAEVAALLAAAGHRLHTRALGRPPDAAIAAVAAARLAGRIAALAPAPIYADDLFTART